MKSFESAKTIAVMAETAVETRHWGGQVWENKELGCFEAGFVIELDGIGFTASVNGVPVSRSIEGARDEAIFRKFQEGQL